MVILKAQVLVTTTSPESRFEVSAHCIAGSVRVICACAAAMTGMHNANKRRKSLGVFLVGRRTKIPRRTSLHEFMIGPLALKLDDPLRTMLAKLRCSELRSRWL